MNEAIELQKAFGKHIQQLREERNLSKTAFADLMGKERIDVTQIEKGERNVTLKTLLSLSKALEVPLISLLDFDRKLEAVTKKPVKQAKTPPAKKKAARKTKK